MNFSELELLMKHVLDTHDCPWNYKCELCDKTFWVQFHLREHLKTTHEIIKDTNVHEGMKQNQCNHCGKIFTQAGNLRIHIKAVHEGVKEHVCNHCGKGFSQAGNLKTHVEAVHEGVNDQRCKICWKKFLSVKILTR